MNTHMQQFQNDPAIKDILAERARELAAQSIDRVDTEQSEEVLTFQLGEGRYGIPACYIREVQPLTHLTRLPTTPAFVVGLVNVRGKILTALDIRPLLDIEGQPPESEALLVVVQVQGTDVCLLADDVIEVRHNDSEIFPALSATGGRGVSWVSGLDTHMNVLIDLPQMLADPRVIVEDEAA